MKDLSVNDTIFVIIAALFVFRFFFEVIKQTARYSAWFDKKLEKYIMKLDKLRNSKKLMYTVSSISVLLGVFMIIGIVFGV